MLSVDRPEFLRILNGLAAIKPGAKLTPEGIEVWWLSMGDWSIEDFKAGAARLAKNIEFMPSPFHFEQLRAAARPTSGEAFARAVKHAASSAYRDGLLGDSVIDGAVMALGGYSVIAMTDVDKLPFLERRFAEHYGDIQDAQETREQLPQLMAPETRHRLPQSVVALLAAGSR